MNRLSIFIFAGLVAVAAAGCTASRESLIPTRDNVTESQFRNEIRKSEVPVLVVFGAVWCVPCHKTQNAVEDVAGEYDGWVSFMFLNADTSVSVTNAMGVNSIPTMILFDGGREVERMVGDVERDALTDMLNRVLDI